MSFRYIGSKSRLVGPIGEHISKWSGKGRFVDAFCGTGAVAETAANAGWPIHVNDNLACATAIASARFIAYQDVNFAKLGGYEATIDALNRQSAIMGFIWRQYSPASANFIGIERRYFREENAGRIDAIRSLIGTWRRLAKISATEERLLIADLLSALSRVANIAGTYGCFMAKWTPAADESLQLRVRALRETTVNCKVTTKDVGALEVGLEDLVYLDPPYTKRQYASYYHVLETVTIGDSPEVQGVSGLRPWRDRASDFCYKTKALAALYKLIQNLKSRRVLLSYSDEAHIPIPDLQLALSSIGRVTCHVVKTVGRYRPNRVASSSSSSVREYLFVINRDETRIDQPLSA